MPNAYYSDPRRTDDQAALEAFFARIASLHGPDAIRFLCIGTDRSTGDSLGPWVGTMLRERGFGRVHGTLEAPCDADRLPAEIASLTAGEPVVAIDACLGRPENVGRCLLAEGPLQPARSVGGSFPPVGAYSVAAVVNAVGPKPYWTLQTTSLYRVLTMAEEIANAAAAAWGKDVHLNSWKAIRYNRTT
ncbi:spore protease YyaC [Cohnella fermenti]|uniref:Spore protease YyaC n=1 Tax=Cohnella fermenti TaxID=2565925 RepID=A0A4S4BRA8_9BACL|nr:spore protease YyaC [Cohnella fermenti]THF77508.1 spore protease YyaC [Cohnella fermenti]